MARKKYSVKQLRALNSIRSVFGYLTAISGLFLGVSTSGILNLLDGKTLHFLILAVVFGLIFTIANWVIGHEALAIEETQGPHGESVQKATLKGFEKEVEEAALEAKKEATGFFNNADHDFKAHRYREAADGYRKSVEALPTMSGYLNLGISLYNLSEYKKAMKAYDSGLVIARKEGEYFV